MMRQEHLRKADLITGGLIFLFGLWIVWEALKMPMKDSYGGVQNVWYVSPALFPIFTGGALMALGVMLVCIAFKALDKSERQFIRQWFRDKRADGWSLSNPMLRFYSIVIYFVFFVYMNIPRVDFVLSSLIFLAVFILPFYIDDAKLMRVLTLFYLLGSLCFSVYYMTGLSETFNRTWAYATDVLNLIFLMMFIGVTFSQIRGQSDFLRKFRTGMIVTVLVPLILCPVFKYFLLVPLPAEGMFVAMMDAIAYSIPK